VVSAADPLRSLISVFYTGAATFFNKLSPLLDELVGACRANGEKTTVYRLLVGNRSGKRSLGRPRRTWVDNI
jgi:hypothetical protein